MEKLTDNEIIKALECCVNCKCKECHCYKNIEGEMRCTEIDEEEILDLINRQNEEIDRLLRAIEDKHCVYEKRVVSEAIKEFAESILDLFPTDKNFTTISRFTIKKN